MHYRVDCLPFILVIEHDSMSKEGKHHYIPVFYLRQWAGSDGIPCGSLLIESVESEMSATLEERLQKIEQGDEALRQYFLSAMQADTTLYVGDFLIFGALKRTLALSAGFRGHIRDRNFTCAGALLRLQLDTALRLYAANLHKNPQEYADAVFKGARVDKLKDKHGKRLTDAYLAEKLSEKYPWVKSVYENLCDFIHFSNRHIFASMAKLDDGERTVHLQISAEDPPRPDSDYFEIVGGYYETMHLTVKLAAGWHQAMHSPASAA
jgi:hypothetical protein